MYQQLREMGGVIDDMHGSFKTGKQLIPAVSPLLHEMKNCKAAEP